eukprot:m.11775 g.11775  ORF g.11775 m.11775 type:complete len:216 (+) comp4521_c0_seq1:123-770(+)
MGCGGSKATKVAPTIEEKDTDEAAPTKTQNSSTSSTTTPQTNDGATNDNENDTIPMPISERATSFVVGYEDSKPAQSPPKRLQHLKKKTFTKEEIEDKQRKADERRQEEIKKKLASVEAGESRRDEIKNNSARSRVNKALELDKKLNEAASKRDEQLEERRKKAKEEELKGQEARARRDQAASEETSGLEAGGELADEDTEKYTEEEKTEAVESW